MHPLLLETYRSTEISSVTLTMIMKYSVMNINLIMPKVQVCDDYIFQISSLPFLWGEVG